MNYADDEKIVDLKELLYYVLKRWKILLAFCLLGVLLGSAFSLVQGQKTVDDLDTAALNMDKIAQYDHYQQLLKEQTSNMELSFILTTDPYSAHNTYKSYYLTLPLESANFVLEQYNTILTKTEILQEMVESSGFDCDQLSMKELICITPVLFETPFASQADPVAANAKLCLSVQSPEQASSAELMRILDSYVVQLNDRFAKAYDGFRAEMLSESYENGYSSGLYALQTQANTQLKFYSDKIAALKKQLTADELFYYENGQHPEQNTIAPLVKRTIKYAVLLGALLFILACGCFGVLFLMDDHIKTAREVSDYGLHVIACLQRDTAKKADWIDRLFIRSKPSFHSKEYLLNALKALSANQTVLCSDSEDALSANLKEWLGSQMEQLRAANILSDDGTGLITAKESEGAILFIHLWHTTSFNLKRELEILRQINCPVKGVVVLHN